MISVEFYDDGSLVEYVLFGSYSDAEGYVKSQMKDDIHPERWEWDSNEKAYLKGGGYMSYKLVEKMVK